MRPARELRTLHMELLEQRQLLTVDVSAVGLDDALIHEQVAEHQTNHAASSASATSVVINEVTDGNSDVLATQTRIDISASFATVPITPDWVELYNPDSVAVDLAGYYLTDDIQVPLKWEFPVGTSIPAQGYLAVFASGLDITDPNLDITGRLHTNFRLNSNGEYLALHDSAGQLLFEYAPEFAELKEGFSYGLDSNQDPAIFGNPTPEAVNDDSSIVAGYVEDTTFSQDRGFYAAPITVEIRSETPGATIVYTTDGSEPTLSNGTQVTAPDAMTAPVAAVLIETTTVLRARAVLAGWASTDVDTQTYLFLGDVLQQPAQPSGFPTSWGGAPSVDYELDPDIVDDSSYTQDLLDGLRELPTLSVSSSVENLFGPAGIYSNTLDTDLEVVSAAELIYGDGSDGFQVDAGFKIQGGASREPNKSPKHSFSLRFRDSIGPGKLNFPLFEDSPVSSFNSIQLRARYNNSWIHSQSSQRERATMIRDVWMRDTLLAMGQVDAGQSQFVHLYLNGLYWGVYSMEERPEASHYAEYFGGDASEYDAINGGSPVDGDLTSYAAMKATVATKDWNAIQQVLDVDNYIDWTIMQRFGSNNDLKSDGNWRAAGGGTSQAPWRFYSWDSERVLEGVGEGRPSPVSDPVGILSTLDDIEEFRLRFADRIQQHFFHEGALTPEKTIERWQKRADELHNAIVAETARWGDYRSSQPYERDAQWLTEINRLVNSYFPSRTAIVLNQYRSLGLYPNVEAAVTQINGVAQHGGNIEAGALLTFAASGDVYYTLDGTDPRASGGAAIGTLYRPGVDPPIVLEDTTTIQARVRSGSTWSALSSAEFVVPDSPELAITEVHYNPNDPTLANDQDLEFIEILNIGTETADLTGVQLTEFSSTPYVFEADLRVEPGQYLIVARDPMIFQSVYGTQVHVAAVGFAPANLGNGGETIALVSAQGETLVRFTYDDQSPWETAADGQGPSLEIIDPALNPDDPTNWRTSLNYGGSPGFAASQSGDFDFDRDVDGADFLAWQRGFGTVHDGNSLPDWREHFGQPTQPSAAAANSSGGSLRAGQTSLAAIVDPRNSASSVASASSAAELVDAVMILWEVPAVPNTRSDSMLVNSEPRVSEQGSLSYPRRNPASSARLPLSHTELFAGRSTGEQDDQEDSELVVELAERIFS